MRSKLRYFMTICFSMAKAWMQRKIFTLLYCNGFVLLINKKERKKKKDCIVIFILLTGDRECDHENGIEKCHRGSSLASFLQKIAEYYPKRRSWPERCNLEKKINVLSSKINRKDVYDTSR